VRTLQQPDTDTRGFYSVVVPKIQVFARGGVACASILAESQDSSGEDYPHSEAPAGALVLLSKSLTID
jgi:hypothetical protein